MAGLSACHACIVALATATAPPPGPAAPGEPAQEPGSSTVRESDRVARPAEATARGDGATAPSEGAGANPPPRRVRCAPGTEPCVRPDAARGLLLAMGILAGGVAAGLLFALGDRASPGDPPTALVGLGTAAGLGALFGFAASRLGTDRPELEDRVRPATVGLDWQFSPVPTTDERDPARMSLRLGPTWRFADDARIRLLAHVGGSLGRARQVDPRPQLAAVRPNLEGTAPIAATRRLLALGAAIDLATALPYPLVRRSSWLGRAELRLRPGFEMRRELVLRPDADPRVIERTMLLPLTAGVRWHVSPRQRFTMYAGPRWDFLAYDDDRDGGLRRGRPRLAPIYAEAWYDIDFAFTERPRRDARPRRVDAHGMLTLGYVHSRFDGMGFNFGPVIGFLGPVIAGWTTRVRPRGSPVAVQAGVTARIADDARLLLDVGLVAPDLRRRRAR
jgi:hypothetical protein